MNNMQEYNPLNHSVVQALIKADGYQQYECPSYVVALIRAIKDDMEVAYWNVNQEQFEHREDWQFTEWNGFAYRRYTYAECDCGAESPVHDKSCRQVAEHDEWNSRRLEAISDPHPDGPPSYEEIAAFKSKAKAEGRQVDAMALMFMFGHRFSRTLNFGGDRERLWIDSNPHPPCTCGASESWNPRENHLATCSPQLPNLTFEDVRISWYKYIGRGMSVNVDWTERQWVEWFNRLESFIEVHNSCFNHCESRHMKKDCPKGRRKRQRI